MKIIVLESIFTIISHTIQLFPTSEFLVFLGYITQAHTIQLLCDFEFEEHELTQFNYFVNQSGKSEIFSQLL